MPRLFVRPGIFSATICDNSVVIPSGSLVSVLFYIMTGSIDVVDCLDRCIFAPESAIYRICLLVELVGFPILLIKLISGLLILNLFIISSNPNPHPFSLPPSSLLYYAGLLFMASFLAKKVYFRE